ncbi:HIT family protein [Streptomyces sp. NPDC056660]|uniref:HIT family protein n=1 Tax=Streptomyces sp. NPDC056660 TaxID=3345897 RepID=UPI0036CD9A33
MGGPWPDRLRVHSARPSRSRAHPGGADRLARAMRSGLNATGVNVLNASGPGSEQSVPHLHFHAVPRWPDDGISTWPTGQSQHRFDGDPAARLADALTAGKHHGS